MDTGNPLFNFQFQQEDLEAHAKVSQWKWTSPEFLKSNNQFGLASILKEYAGLPQEYPLRLTMEHGVNVADGINIASNTIAKTILTTSRNRADFINQKPGAHAMPVGFGYLYAIRLFDKFKLDPIPEEKRKGTLVFPSKAFRDASSQFDHAAYAEQLSNLPEHLQPVYACIYCRASPEVSRIYNNAGIPTITAGQRLDPMFLYRFHDMCRRFRYATSTDFGGHLFYSASSGCRFFYCHLHDIKKNYKSENHVGDLFDKHLEESLRIFNEPVEEITPEQRAYVDANVGTQCVVSPRRLKRILLQGQRRFENRPWWHGERKLLSPPDAFNYAWEKFAPCCGWGNTESYIAQKADEMGVRWMGPTKEAWVDLYYPHRLRKRHAFFSCQIDAINYEELKISVNGKKLSGLTRTNNEKGFVLDGSVSRKILANPPAANTVRIGFHASGAQLNQDGHWKSMRGAAVGKISLRPQD